MAAMTTTAGRWRPQQPASHNDNDGNDNHLTMTALTRCNNNSEHKAAATVTIKAMVGTTATVMARVGQQSRLYYSTILPVMYSTIWWDLDRKLGKRQKPQQLRWKLWMEVISEGLEKIKGDFTDQLN